MVAITFKTLRYEKRRNLSLSENSGATIKKAPDVPSSNDESCTANDRVRILPGDAAGRLNHVMRLWREWVW